MKNTKKIYWTEGMVSDKFGLQRINYEQFVLLRNWTMVKCDFTREELIFMEETRSEALKNIDFWNEEELKMWFISDIIKLSQYHKETEYRAYFEKKVAATVNDIPLKLNVDFLIAKGVGDYVKYPYFCFHEYKREKKYNDDPAAQVLLAMLVAQEINQNEKPLYGAYVISRNWYFMILDKNEYAIAQPLCSTEKEDLHKIVSILREFKVILKEKILK